LMIVLSRDKLNYKVELFDMDAKILKDSILLVNKRAFGMS